jgi:hypothetical protein
MYTTNIAVIYGRLGVKKDKLRTEAVAKLQGELEKEGRAAASSVAMPAKTAVGATTSTKRTSSRRGSYFLYKNMLNFLIHRLVPIQFTGNSSSLFCYCHYHSYWAWWLCVGSSVDQHCFLLLAPFKVTNFLCRLCIISFMMDLLPGKDSLCVRPSENFGVRWHIHHLSYL